MSWCRSYGCREHVEQSGDYCAECQDIIQTEIKEESDGGPK